jgi:acetylornithine deacetylase
MKGGLVAALFAARAIRDAGVRLKGRLILQSVVGEEDGGIGTLAAIQRGYRADAAVIMEPTGFTICPSQAGCLNFRITVKGRAAHGCVREEGVSALEKFQIVHEELLALERRRNHNCKDPMFQGYGKPFSLSVGTIAGGNWPSTVPDWVRVEGRYGVSPDEGEEEARAALQDTLAECSRGDPWLREHPPELEWWGGRFLPARIPPGHPIVKTIQSALLSQGRTEAPVEGVTFGSDMRLLVREADIPTVLFGPGDIRMAHTADESVVIEDLELTARTLALTALRFCGYEDDLPI